MLTRRQYNERLRRGTMPKGSEELTNARRDEIINACEALYKTMSFKEITLKNIGDITSFTRTSIYNYFRTKEEIFLALFEREYEHWNAALNDILDGSVQMTADGFADAIARSLENRQLLLKIMSMNLYDIECNSRQERLTDFKAQYGRCISSLEACLEKYFPDMTEAERQDFIYAFFPFMFGIYPYTYLNEKQRAAMEAAGVKYKLRTVYEITCSCVKMLLGG